MTTIAFRDGILAADTQGSWGGTPTIQTKIRRLPKFALAGAGIIERILDLEDDLRAWVNWDAFSIHKLLDFRWERFKGEGAPDYDRDPQVIAVSPHGTVYKLCRDRFSLTTLAAGPFIALGSGSDYALGAMAHGATAAEAVAIAARLDIHTGGEIQTLKVKDLTP